MTVNIYPGQGHDPFQPPTEPLEQPLPNAAQIPLQTFQLPDFPPEAAHLKDLTLTSDIKPTEYSDLLATALSTDAVPNSIPKGIESLTLELFSLGYPSSFLARLGRALPRLKALTLYCHLVDGTSDASRKDAGEFMYNALVGNKENGGGLRELHLLDVFCRKRFFSGVGSILEDLASNDLASEQTAAMRFLEVSYTYRGHSDPGFLSRIPADELPLMLVPSLIAVSFRLQPASSEQKNTTGLDDPADVDADGNRIPGQKPQGMLPLPSTHPGTTLLAEKLAGIVKEAEEAEVLRPKLGPQALKMLDCTLYTLTLDQLAQVLDYQTELAVLNASVLVGTDGQTMRSLWNAMESGSKSLETVEIVGVPEEKFDKENSSLSAFRKIFPTSSAIASLSECLPRLDTFNMTILCAPKFGSVRWRRQLDGKWAGGFIAGGDKGS